MGRATAALFAREGAAVVIADLQEAAGTAVAAEITACGGRALFVPTDVTRAGDLQHLVDRTVQQFGRLDILFNNAGIPLANTPFEAVSEETWDRLMTVNVKSVFLGAKAVLPVMKAQGGGVILNTASTAAVRPRPGQNAYAVSKAAVVSLTKVLALDLAQYRIRVNAINPVATETPMLAGFLNNEDVEAAKVRFASGIPLGRLARPEDIAAAALYLASDEASLVTGVALDVDGGRSV